MTNKGVGVVIAGVAACIVFGPAARADDQKIDWPVSCKIVQQESHSLPAPDKIVFAGLAKCTIKMPGDPIEGSEVFVVETYVLDKAKGLDHGVISFSTDKGSITDAFWGYAKTEMVNGQPHTTTNGLFKVNLGTGSYAGYTGTGTYTGGFSSDTTHDIELKGTMVPKKQATQ